MEKMVRNNVIPALTGRAQPDEVNVNCLRCRLAWRSGFGKSMCGSDRRIHDFAKNSEPIRKLIINQKPTLENAFDETYALKRTASATRMRRQKESVKALSPQLPPASVEQ